MTDEETKPRCFIAMPITTHDDEAQRYEDPEHWVHVRQTLFVTAIRAAGYEPVLPEANGSYLIHERIVTHLETCELVLCDLSGGNPNVFWELGVRTSIDKPIALVWDGLSTLPFDTSGINTHKYDPKMTPWLLAQEQDRLRQHIIDSADSCSGRNPMWQKFGLTIRAQEPHSDASPLEAKVDLLTQEVMRLSKQGDQERLRRGASAALGRVIETRAASFDPASPDHAFGRDDDGSQRAAALAFCQYVVRWAIANGRKATAEQTPLAANAVEVRGVEGDHLTAEDVNVLKVAATDYGVTVVAHGGHGKIWIDSEFHEALVKEYGDSSDKSSDEG